MVDLLVHLIKNQVEKILRLNDQLAEIHLCLSIENVNFQNNNAEFYGVKFVEDRYEELKMNKKQERILVIYQEFLQI